MHWTYMTATARSAPYCIVDSLSHISAYTLVDGDGIYIATGATDARVPLGAD